MGDATLVPTESSACARVDNYMDPRPPLADRDAATSITEEPEPEDDHDAGHDVARTLTAADADRLRKELLELMVPFPPSPESLRGNTLAALQLIKGLPDEQLAKVTNFGGFIEAVTGTLGTLSPEALVRHWHCLPTAGVS